QPGVKTQIATVPDTGHHRIGDGADADLNRRAILDVAPDVAGDRLLTLTDRLWFQGGRRSRNLDVIVNAMRAQIGVAIGPGRLIVYFRNNDASFCDRRVRVVIGKRKTILTVIVRRSSV